jgi:hypothetical protein
MNNETCIHGGITPVNLLKNLHDSQAGSGRHRCPSCAYEEGFNLGSSKQWASYDAYCTTITDPEKCTNSSTAPSSILSMLGDNQGGSGRHKCTNCAFKEGFNSGLVGVYVAKYEHLTNDAIQNKISEIKKNKPDNTNPLLLELVERPKIGLKFKITKPIVSSEINFIEREIQNTKLGYLGELFILKNEINYLLECGKKDLAERVSHVSKEQGDGLGYDILSFDINGNEKKIEVKTTRGKIDRPFYITRNELNCSIDNSKNYHLFRLFDFDSKLNKGKYYIVSGDLTEGLDLDPLLYIAYPKKML